MGFGFEQIGGLLGLLALVPFIVVYLIKPRPVKLPVPSLMFFMRRAKATTKESFLRVFQKDYLFYIQLAVLLLLAFSLAYPYISMQQDVVSKNLVFVLDVSASSQVNENGKTRLDIAKQELAKLATDSNTVVLAKSAPVVALSNAGKSEFTAFLNRIKPSDDESRIGDALLLAGETLKGEKGRVVAASDFINTRGVSVQTAADILKGRGDVVDMINTASSRHGNIGITDIISDEESTSVYIRNFNGEQRSVNLGVDGVSNSITVDANNIETLIYKTKEGVSRIQIADRDDFMADNTGYVSNPAGKKINVAVVTNYPSRFLMAALNSSSRIRLVKAEPPVIPKEDVDVYIIGRVDMGKVLPGTFEDITKKASEGASVIITAQDGIERIDFKGLSNVHFSKKNLTSKTTTVALNKITRFTKDVDFGNVKKAYNLESFNGDVIAESNGVPLIIYSEYGKGKFVYYGINEKDSSFHLSPDYPVFWTGLVKFLAGAREMSELNLKTGMSFIGSNGNEVILDRVGVFNISDSEVAVNLADDKESSINQGEEYGSKIGSFRFETIKEEVKDNITDWLIFIGLLLVIFEIYYVKRRGTL